MYNNFDEMLAATKDIAIGEEEIKTDNTGITNEAVNTEKAQENQVDKKLNELFSVSSSFEMNDAIERLKILWIIHKKQ